MTQAQSIKNFADNHLNILLIPSKDEKIDSLACSYALALVLQNIGKNPLIYFPTEPPQQLRFLNIQKFLIKDFTTTTAWDGVIYVGEKSKEQKENKFIFQNLSDFHIFNIEADYPSESLSEILTRALKELDETFITDVIATSLLAGIVSSTKNFQSPKIKPQTLFASAYLISKRAKNELVVQYLYKIKSLETVKLWGSVIANFSYRDDKKIGWSFINYQDIKKNNVQPARVAYLINELKNNFGQAEVFILGVGQPQNKNVAIIHSPNTLFTDKLSLKTGAILKNSSCILRLHPAYPIKIATKKAVEEIATNL